MVELSEALRIQVEGSAMCDHDLRQSVRDGKNMRPDLIAAWSLPKSSP